MIHYWAHLRERKAGDRVVGFLSVLTTLLFQTHWIDDFGTSESDTLGITVSALGTLLLLGGLVLWKRSGRRGVLAFAFVCTALVSAADLCGVNAEGAFAPDLQAHWRDTLGWRLAFLVALTLVSSLAGAVRLLTTTSLPREVAARRD